MMASMTRDELIENTARTLCREISGAHYDDMQESATYLHRKSNPEAPLLDKQEAREVATIILKDIFAALREPTEEMMQTIGATSIQRLVWHKMLSASPLAPKEE